MATQGNKGSSAALEQARAAVEKLLKNPEVRKQLISAGVNVADRLRAAAAERPKRTKAHGSGTQDGVVEVSRLTPWDRQNRLERRAENLRRTVADLRVATGPEALHALDGMVSALDKVALTLNVAKTMPVTRRLATQREVAKVLGDLERAVIAATMPPRYSTDGSGDTPER